VILELPAGTSTCMNIPGGIDVPGAELAYRVHDIARSPETLVVVIARGARAALSALSRSSMPARKSIVALQRHDGVAAGRVQIQCGADRRAPESRRTGSRGPGRRQRCGAIWRARHRSATLEIFKREAKHARSTPRRAQPEEYEVGHIRGRSRLRRPARQATDRYVGTTLRGWCWWTTPASGPP
jgi:hypothetical protein